MVRLSLKRNVTNTLQKVKPILDRRSKTSHPKNKFQLTSKIKTKAKTKLENSEELLFGEAGEMAVQEEYELRQGYPDIFMLCPYNKLWRSLTISKFRELEAHF